ncbi:MAG: leucine-rich repeat protein [Oscillospiraceae bacterium]|nr:leucine-rich repeat protein [Oscillospiraceae bacterium]
MKTIILSSILAGTLVLGVPTVAAAAESATPAADAVSAVDKATTSDTLSNDVFNYTIDSLNRVTITKCISTDENITVPKTLPDSNGEECNVTTIGPKAFSAAIKTVKKITVESGVRTISANAFTGCTLLESVSLPNSITSMGQYAFSKCSALKTVNIPTGMSAIPSYAFSYCTSLTSIYIPENITSIQSYAFKGCIKLADVNYPLDLALDASAIASSAFDQCPVSVFRVEKDITGQYLAINGMCGSKDDVVIPTEIGGMKVIAIADEAFGKAANTPYFASIKAVTIPEGITTIGKKSFAKAADLIKVSIPSTVTIISESAFEQCTSLISAPLHDKIIEIGTNAFKGCSSMKTATIYGSTTKINDGAFQDCTSISSISLPNSVTEVGEEAFRNCSSMTTLKLSESLSEIKRGTFAQCLMLSSIDFPESITSIADGTKTSGKKLDGDGAFSDCRSLTEVVFHKKFRSIGAAAFSDCFGIEKITLPEGLKNISDLAFSGCMKLDNVVIPTSISVINRGTFSCCLSLTNVTIPSSVTTIADGKTITTTSLRNDGAFGYCPSLKKIVLPNVSTVGKYAFSECSNLTDVQLKKGVVNTIGDYCFAYDTKLVGIQLYDSISAIGKGAFKGCTSLASIVIPENPKLTSISADMFAQCSELSSVTLPGNITSFAAGTKVTNLKATTPAIGDGVFSDCTALAEIKLPASLTSIGKAAFSGCQNLQSIELPGKVTTVGDYAFYDCRTMDSLKLSPVISSIGKYAFESCAALPEFTIPKTVKTIGNGALSACEGMKKLSVTADVLKKDFYKNVILTHSNECMKLYGQEGLIQKNLQTVEIMDGVQTIAENAFAYADALEKINISSTVKSIGKKAFFNCTSLNVINTIPTSVTMIDENAFAGCTNLKAIVIPSTVLTIGDKAFAGCVDLVIFGKTDSAAYQYYLNDNENIEFVDVYYVTKITSAKLNGNKVEITWENYPNDSGYDLQFYVYRSEDNGAMVKIGETTSTKYVDSNVVTGKTYSYSVAIYNKTIDLTSDLCDPVTVKVFIAEKPKVTATAGNKQVTLNWNKVNNATKYVVYSYVDNKSVQLGTTTANSYVAKNLTNGKKYGFYVKALVNGVWSNWTAEDVVYATPSADANKPKNLKAAAGNKQVTLTWDKVTNATKYVVYSYVDNKSVQLGTCTANSYVAKNLTNGKRYGFYVKALVNGAWSDWSTADLVYATPSAPSTKPQNVKAAAGNKQVTLTWDKVTNATKYVVYSYVDGKYAQLGTCTANSYVAKNLTNGKRYGFYVKALVNGAWSDWSTADLVYATPNGPTKPQNVKATAGNGEVTITWNTVAGASKYVVYRYADGKYAQLGTCTANKYVATGLTNGKEYGFYVKALVNGAWSDWSEDDLVYATPNGPTKPQNVRAKAGNGQVTITWNAVNGASKYVVYRYADGKYAQLGTCTTTSYTAEGLTNGKEYGFYVKALVNGAWSDWSEDDLVFATPNA